MVLIVCGYGFYHVFRAFCGDNQGAIQKFKVSWCILVVMFSLQSVADLINWNSFTRWNRLFKNGHVLAAVMCLIEWVLVLFTIVYFTHLILEVRKTRNWKR